jgi:hypothetical protein
VPIVLKYGSLTLLKSSRPVQTCKRIALALQSRRIEYPLEDRNWSTATQCRNISINLCLSSDNFSCSVYFLIVYISFIMQHVNNILIVCFLKIYENLCPSHERPSFGLSCGYSIYMAKAVLEYFVRRVLITCLEIPFQRALPTVLTTNRGNAMIM